MIYLLWLFLLFTLDVVIEYFGCVFKVNNCWWLCCWLLFAVSRLFGLLDLIIMLRVVDFGGCLRVLFVLIMIWVYC